MCAVSDSERIDIASGRVLFEGAWTLVYEEAMQKVDGVWKLAERRQDGQTEGVTGCAVD